MHKRRSESILKWSRSLVCGAIMLGPCNAFSAMWTGSMGPMGFTWSNASNWQPMMVPFSGDMLSFPNIDGTIYNSTNDLGPPLGVNGVSIAASSTGYFIAGPGQISWNPGSIFSYDNTGVNDTIQRFDMQSTTDNALSINTTGTGTARLYTGSIGGSGSVTVSGTSLTFSTTNSFSGGLTIQSGAFLETTTQDLNNPFGNGAVIVGSGATIHTTESNTILNIVSFSVTDSIFDVASAKVFTIQGVVSGNNFTVQGGGTLALSNTGNTYTGTATIASGSTLSGDAAAIKGNLDNSGIVSIDVSTGNTKSFSGVISNSGVVKKTGAGTLILSGTNTYSGLTTVEEGELQGTTTTLPGDILVQGGQLLTFNQSSTGTFSHVVSGDGAVKKSGTGTVILSGANTYSGLTTVGGGELQGTTTTLPGDVLVEGGFLLTFDQSTTGTFSHVISGEGAVKKSGTGTVTLSGANTYSGLTTVEGGELQGTTTTLPGNISVESGQLVTFDQSSNGTFFHTISGDGAVKKSGTGMVILTEANTYNGPTTVDGGILAINGSITSAVTVNSGATLQGSENLPSLPARITGNVDVKNGGKLAPGNSIGTINVVGAVNFEDGSIFNVELSPTETDKLVVTGTGGVTISPTAIFNLDPTPGVYPSSHSSLVIDASGSTGGISGSFLIINNSYPLFSPTFVQTANTLTLVLDVEPLTELVSTGNAGEAAKCLSAANPSSGSDLDFVIGELTLATSAEELKNALTQMQPSQFTAFSVIQQELSIKIASQVTQKLHDLHSRCLPEKKGSGDFWVNLLGDLSIQKKTRSEEPGYIARSGATLVGYDYTFPQNISLGVCGSYSFTGFNWKMGRGRGQIQSYYGMAYGAFSRPHFLLTGSLIGAYNHYQGTRNIDVSFIPVDRKASHTHRGYEIGGNITIALPFKKHSVTFMPFFSSDAIYLHQGSLREYGASSLDLNVNAVNSQYYREEIGLDLQKCRLFNSLKWTGSIQLSYIREIRLQGRRLEAQFRDVDCSYKVKGFYPSRNLVSPAASLNVATLNDKLSISLLYSGVFGTNFFDQDLNLRFGYSF